MRTVTILLALTIGGCGGAIDDPVASSSVAEEETLRSASGECPTGAPVLETPRPFEHGVDLHWRGAQERYSVDIAADNGARVPFEAFGDDAEAQLPPGHYSVRVRGIACQTMPGRWSNVEEFTIAPGVQGNTSPLVTS